MIYLLFISKASPRVEEQICLIGLRPFLGIQCLFSTQQNLILLARSHESPTNSSKSNAKSTKQSKKQRSTTLETASDWTIYNLKTAQADILYRDFMELAANHATDFSETASGCDSDKIKIYALLLSEAHTILRIAKEISSESGNNTSKSSTAQSNEINNQIDDLFLSSCQQLADFFVM